MPAPPDQVPGPQRGSVSANVGIMQNVGILAAAFLAAAFVDDMVALFVVPGVLMLVLVTVYCLVLPDRPITERPRLGGWTALLRTFWVSPRQHPDFAWAWLARFLVVLAFFLFSESPSSLIYPGGLLILAGIYLVARVRREPVLLME